jgi:hypothetical protein
MDAATRMAAEAIARGNATHLFEQEKCLAIGFVVADGTIARDKLHVAHLALARVQIDAVLRPAIVIPVLLAGISSEQKHERGFGGGTDASPLLSAIFSMDICPSILLSWHKLMRHSYSILPYNRPTRFHRN